jgi:hypothetical protein
MNWRSWADDPPQIPWAPIDVRIGRLIFSGVMAVQVMHETRPNIDRWFWRPLGIYREEFYEVTRRWE